MLFSELQAEDRVLNFLKQHNRPYNVQVMILLLFSSLIRRSMASSFLSSVLQNVCDHLAQVWPIHASYLAPMLNKCYTAWRRPLCSLV